jgi:hypothetical protein
MSKFYLGVSRNKVDANGVRRIQYAADHIEIDLSKDEMLSDIWLSTGDGLDLMRWPLEIVGMAAELYALADADDYPDDECGCTCSNCSGCLG